MTKATRKEALNAKGRLKKGFYFEKGGQLRRAVVVPKSAAHREAVRLGRLGGKASARSRQR